MADVSKQEEEKLKKSICPDCNGRSFLEGPSGGGSVNIMCANKDCQARFNISWPFAPERLEYGKMKLGPSSKATEDNIIQDRFEILDL